jgi:ADP-ribose pyrophosphatase YjhB (NUDIX family)
MNTLIKKEREQIFGLFQDQYELKFSHIEQQIKIRSNMVAYHLDQMVKDGLLQKRGTAYSLSAQGEQYLPHFAHLTRQELGPLPVMLIAPIKNGKVFLIQRKKRPYQGYWGMIGGKMRFGESFEECCERKLFVEGELDGKFDSLCAIANERVQVDAQTKHSFLLLFAKAKVKSVKSPSGKWFNLKNLEKVNLIPSDRWLLEEKLGEKISHSEFLMQERGKGFTLLVR